MGRQAGPPTRMVRVFAADADTLADRATGAKVSVAEVVAGLVRPAARLPQPAQPTADLLAGRCTCSKPEKSAMVPNWCKRCKARIR